MKYDWPNIGALELLSSGSHSFEVLRERRRLLISRVRLAAGILSVLTLGWIVIDAFTLKWPVWGILALERLFAAAAFLMLALPNFWIASITTGAAIGALILVEAGFLLAAHVALQSFPLPDGLIFVSTAYSYAPFLLAASLSIFPLTAVESALLSLPILSVIIESLLSHPELFASASATFLRLFLLLGISAFAGMSQVRLLIALTEQSTRDRLTGVLTRRAGEIRINSSFRLAELAQQPLSLLFFDLDHFKSINDRFGHAVGDAILQSAARSISRYLGSDAAVIRWGGEEFVVLLPQTGSSAAREIVERIGADGLGRTPDGAHVTASVGIAEWIRDRAPDPAALVRLSDRRMYAAKSAGRNCYVSDYGAPTRFVGRENAGTADIPARRHSTTSEPGGWMEPKTLLAS